MDVPADVLVEIFVVIVCVFMLIFYAQKRMRSECGWEVLFVCTVEGISHTINLLVGEDHLIDTADGRSINWFRYAGWLITCPVILIHLSNLEGKKVYDQKTSLLFLTVNQAMIVAGLSASFSTITGWRWFFFTLGCLFYSWLCYLAFQIFAQTYAKYPDSGKQIVELLAFVFFTSWTSFPILWILGSEGTGIISHRGSVLGHAVADLVSKNLFGYLAWYLRWNQTRTLEKTKHMTNIMRRAATGDVPRILIVGSSDKETHLRYIASIACEAGFVADIVTGTANFEKVLDERMVPTWATGYACVVINGECIAQILEAEQRGDGSGANLALIRDKIGKVPVIGYTSSDQLLSDSGTLFNLFSCTHGLKDISEDNSPEGLERTALRSLLERAVDSYLEDLAIQSTANTRNLHTDLLGIHVQSFAPKKIRSVYKGREKDNSNNKSKSGSKKKRRPSIIGGLLSKGAAPREHSLNDTMSREEGRSLSRTIHSETSRSRSAGPSFERSRSGMNRKLFHAGGHSRNDGNSHSRNDGTLDTNRSASSLTRDSPLNSLAQWTKRVKKSSLEKKQELRVDVGGGQEDYDVAKEPSTERIVGHFDHRRGVNDRHENASGVHAAAAAAAAALRNGNNSAEQQPPLPRSAGRTPSSNSRGGSNPGSPTFAEKLLASSNGASPRHTSSNPVSPKVDRIHRNHTPPQSTGLSYDQAAKILRSKDPPRGSLEHGGASRPSRGDEHRRSATSGGGRASRPGNIKMVSFSPEGGSEYQPRNGKGTGEVLSVDTLTGRRGRQQEVARTPNGRDYERAFGSTSGSYGGARRPMQHREEERMTYL